jgi:type VI protein secretion system component VasK
MKEQFIFWAILVVVVATICAFISLMKERTKLRNQVESKENEILELKDQKLNLAKECNELFERMGYANKLISRGKFDRNNLKLIGTLLGGHSEDLKTIVFRHESELVSTALRDSDKEK